MSVSVLSRDVQPVQQSQVHQWQVHKLRGEEVLLRTWLETSPGHCVLTARWPRGHDFYRPSQGSYDPLLLAETVRQAVPLLSHAVHDVPREYKQAWEEFSFTVEPAASLVTASDEVRLVVSCSDVVRRGSRFAGMTMDTDVYLGKRLMGVAHTRFNNQPAAVYRRLRGSYADLDAAQEGCLPVGPPVDPRRVGRTSPDDVVLSPALGGERPGRWLLRVDPAHPVLFDHVVDHVPGMLLLEAARQAAHDVGGPGTAVIGMRTDFVRYVEFDAPAVVVAGEPVPVGTDRRRIPVRVEQDGVQVFTAEVTIH
ncbi:ScbA/BarX family gamma-butyrolactone biosynthesis protein [Streptomyces sp. NPDC017448]|uniref:ScbA/BarX family gamma-butyrolactone biosynthesis protein n=1 Tax=Streptomyces sp. NPDC017448 TaxID=3364996 RepID=UPI00378B04E4